MIIQIVVFNGFKIVPIEKVDPLKGKNDRSHSDRGQDRHSGTAL